MLKSGKMGERKVKEGARSKKIPLKVLCPSLLQFSHPVFSI
jgi:hypothetical protein